ncbi:MAG: tripartite tricarboxylate transporter permease [archaeon]
MILELLIPIILGIFAGIFTGLMPGIHINLISMMLLLYYNKISSFFEPLPIASFIVSMSITHSFLDFIPSIFLSAPNSQTALSVMPGHKLLLNGKGYAATMLAVKGCFVGVILLIITTPIFIFSMPLIYDFIKRFMAPILIGSVVFLILGERKIIWASLLFIISGLLGVISFNMQINEPLFPLLTGLFGTSMLVASISEKTKVPSQKISTIRLSIKEVFKSSFSGVIGSSLCSFLPGLGASQAAVIASDINGKTNSKSFLFLIGLISTLVTGLNFVAIYAINKPRSGVAIAVSKIVPSLGIFQLEVLLASCFISAVISFYLAIYFSKIFARNISKIEYSSISKSILIFLILMTFLISGLEGIIILITGTIIGVLAIKQGIRKMHLMGCIMLPVITYFLSN